MAEYYLIIKALHIIAIISWMAVLLYLPRLFVYHSTAPHGSDSCKMLQVMEHKLLRFIGNPAMIAAWILGILLIIITKSGAPGSGHWMHVKLLLLVILSASHMMMAKYRKAFATGNNKKSEKFFRIFNEVPTILMIAIVILVVLKPF